MNAVDGPASPRFHSRALRGNISWDQLPERGFMRQDLLPTVPVGKCVGYGLPLVIGTRPILLTAGGPGHTVKLDCGRTSWIVVAHTSGIHELEWQDGRLLTRSGAGRLAEPAAEYVWQYTDGTEVRTTIRRRHEIGDMQRFWGENCTEATGLLKPRPVRGAHEQSGPPWGWSQTRVQMRDQSPFCVWLWAWENPHPKKTLRALRCEPVEGSVLILGISCGQATSHPLRWRERRKALLRLPQDTPFEPDLDAQGGLARIRLDLGQVISAEPQLDYPTIDWAKTYNNAVPTRREQLLLIEYTAHPDACFHLPGRAPIPVARLEDNGRSGPLQVVRPALQTVQIRVVEKGSNRPVPVKFHAHGEAGEYLAPDTRHRLPNTAWFEDYSPEFQHLGIHRCVYIDGETQIRLPLGKVYIEVSKGFEIKPVRRIYEIKPGTRTITIRLDKVLHWRERGWVSSDTHVHFLSPTTGLLEGAAEGVNVVNLLASQWGELMTNVGDFDGRTVHGSREAGGDGEYLLRVGTENRQHVLGHISLVGYEGPIIAPMTTGGPDESALGDPVATLLTEWARQCRQQNGIVVIPHFPNPRLEHAATIVSGNADAIEMCSWGNLYGGLNPYSLADWYRYLNNGYLVPAVGGTDKMSAGTAVGTVRAYAHLPADREFTYDTWKDAIRRAATFVTYGPLLEFAVDGHEMGSKLTLSATGGTVDVTWNVASVTVPMTSVELVANGEVIAGAKVSAGSGAGHFPVKIERSTWLALLVRGHYADQPEIIAAHSSPVMVTVAGSEFYAAADSLSILQQIEGALAYLDTLGTPAEDGATKRLRLVLTSIHRELHNRMHRLGHDHPHTVTAEHAAHSRKRR